MSKNKRKNAKSKDVTKPADREEFSDAEDSKEKEFSYAEDSKKKQDEEPQGGGQQQFPPKEYKQHKLPGHRMSKQDEGPQGGGQQPFPPKENKQHKLPDNQMLKQDEGVQGGGQQQLPPKECKQHKLPGHRMSSQVNVSLYIGVAAIVLFVAYYIYQSQTVNNRLVNVESAVDKLREYKKYLDEIDKLETKVNNLNSNYEDALVKKNKLDEEIQRSENRLKEIDTQLDHNEGKLKEVTSSIDKQSKLQKAVEERVQKNEDSLSKLEGKCGDMQETFTSLDGTVKGLKREVGKFNEDMLSSKSEFKLQQQNIEEIHNQVQGTKLEFQKLNDDVSKVGEELPGIEQKIGEILQRLVAAEQKSEQITKISEAVHSLQEKLHSTVDKAENLRNDVTNFDSKITKFNDELKAYKTGLNDARQKQEGLAGGLDKLKSDAEDVQEKMNTMEHKIEELSIKEENMNKQMDDINEKVSQSEKKVGELKDILDSVKSHTDQQLPQLRTKLLEVEKTANLPYYCVADIFEAVAILVLVVLMKDFLNPSPVSESLEPTKLSSSHTRSVDQSVLSRIYRVPVLENSVCIISFYRETMDLHKSMLSAVLQMRQPTYKIVQCYIRQHDDIFSIPSCRYIFVFVDYNERNIILENPGQDLGDKKLITVQAACKIGATVFVTYVRDRGSRLLPPGALYNTELSSFTSHFELKKLTQQSRCFSVYESYSQTQKDQILEAIRVNN